MSYRPGAIQHANNAALSRLQQPPAPMPQPMPVQPDPQPQPPAAIPPVPAQPPVAQQPQEPQPRPPVVGPRPGAPPREKPNVGQPVDSFKPYGQTGFYDPQGASNLPPRQRLTPTGTPPGTPPPQEPEVKIKRPPKVQRPPAAVWNMDTYNYMRSKYGY